MLTADHPNAQFLRDMYLGGAEIANDATLDPETRRLRMEAHIQRMFAKMAPNFIIHTAGLRLGAKGDVAFMKKYHQRRTALGTDHSGSGVRPVEVTQALADDEYGIIYAVFESDRDGEVYRRQGMGAWRFENGLAVEHWEIGNSRATDEFYSAGDPDWTGGTAEEFWLRD